VREEDLITYAAEQAFPIIPCDLCGSQEHLQRKRVKRLVAELTAENDNVPGNLFAALGKVVPSHLLDAELLARLGEGGAKGTDEGLMSLG
jgi:tRNA 2-thiocytidine biosynthesis protein TtcA